MQGGGEHDGPREEEEGEEEEDSFSEDEGRLLGPTLCNDALARSLVDTQTANELGLVRSEVHRLRAKVAQLEREKDDMADDFRNTTKLLLNRIKELESEVSGALTRPNTGLIIERIEGPSTASRSLGRPPSMPQTPARPGSNGGIGGSPQVLQISQEQDSARGGQGQGQARSGSATCEEETTLCGNCRRKIPAGNVLAHSVSCYRNNFHCGPCDEVIPLREKENHFREWTDPEKLLDAVARKDVEMVQKMIGHSADLCVVAHPQTRDTAMHVAARIGDAEFIAFCMGHGVDISPTNSQGETPLHLAAATASTDQRDGVSPAVRLLVELGAGLNALDSRGESALLLAARRGAALTAKYLVEMRADTEVRTNLGDTALQIAQRSGYQDTVLALVSGGAAMRPGTASRGSTPGPPMPCASPEGSGDRGGSTPPREKRHARSGSGTRMAGSGDGAGYPPKPRIRRSNSVRHAGR